MPSIEGSEAGHISETNTSALIPQVLTPLIFQSSLQVELPMVVVSLPLCLGAKGFGWELIFLTEECPVFQQVTRDALSQPMTATAVTGRIAGAPVLVVSY